MPIEKGMKLRYFKHYENQNIWSGQMTEAFQISYNSDTLWAFIPSVIDDKVRELIDNNYEIIVKNEESAAAWSRAISFVNENSSLRIQTQTDNLIDTYQLKDKCGYTITRYINGNNTIIKIETRNCVNMFTSRNMLMRKAIYFIKYGINEK
jgi:hypothetical protein